MGQRDPPFIPLGPDGSPGLPEGAYERAVLVDVVAAGVRRAIARNLITSFVLERRVAGIAVLATVAVAGVAALLVATGVVVATGADALLGARVLAEVPAKDCDVRAGVGVGVDIHHVVQRGLSNGDAAGATLVGSADALIGACGVGRPYGLLITGVLLEVLAKDCDVRAGVEVRVAVYAVSQRELSGRDAAIAALVGS